MQRSKRPHGEIRQSQVVTTFGPGSMLDLPRHSVLVGGLDEWSLGVGEEIQEARLVQKLAAILQLSELRLQRPPRHDDDPTAMRTGITVWQFPEWFASQEIEGRRGRSRHLVHRKALVKGEYHDIDRRRHRVIPVRFVRACRRGHIGDLDWHGFVHRDEGNCKKFRDKSLANELKRKFAADFRESDWPGERMPEIYYDQRSLEVDAKARASLHAKCVVIDEEVAFVSSANFTEAALKKNIEVGVLIRDPAMAQRLANHFQGLVDAGILLRL